MLSSYLTSAFALRDHQFNTDTENGFRPILCICVCVTIDAMLNFDADVHANADVNGEHTFNNTVVTGQLHCSKTCSTVVRIHKNSTCNGDYGAFTLPDTETDTDIQ